MIYKATGNIRAIQILPDHKPTRSGFGTELITQRVPYELKGTSTIEFRPAGLVATLEFPLADLPSILQTDEEKQFRL